MKKILITGANSYIGESLETWLKKILINILLIHWIC